MKLLASLAGTLAGAATVIVLNQVIRKINPALANTQKGANSLHNDRTIKQKLMVTAVYVAGSLVATAVTRRLKKSTKKSIVSPYNPPEQAYKPILDIIV